MPGEAVEFVLSRAFNLGTSPTRERLYRVHNTEDEEEVQDLLVAIAPNPYLGLVLTSIDAQPLGGGEWEGTARYTRWENQNQRTFSTLGGTQRITQALSSISSYAPSGMVAPDFNGAIGVSDDRVEGVDIVVPTMEFTETAYKTPAQMTNSYIIDLFTLTGRWNASTFRFCAAGECLFRGVSGSQRGDENWELTFNFAVSPNVTGLELGGITGIAKLGWDYLWVRYGDTEDGSAYQLVKRPTSVHVDRVSLPGNFSLLGLP